MTDPKTATRADAIASVQGISHGGDLAQARVAFPDAPEPWIDLSTGINPIPWPLPALPLDAWTRLPEPAAVRALEAAAADAFGLADPACVAATPGTQAAIEMLPRLLDAPSVGILGFTYQEHAHVWRATGRDVSVVDDLDALASFDLGLLVNPNNPDGRLIPVVRLVELAERMARSGRRLIVDEAFVDVLGDDASIAPRLPHDGTIVLRSFGKTWGLAGLRLGFVLADRIFAARVRDAFGPWAVSGPAIAVGRAALADRSWLAATRRRLAADAARLDAILAATGLALVGGTPLFRLVEGDAAARIAVRLGRAGLHVRAFPHDPRLLRFGLPGDDEAWRRLSSALEVDAAS